MPVSDTNAAALLPLWLRRISSVSAGAGILSGMACFVVAQCVALSKLGKHDAVCVKAAALFRELHFSNGWGLTVLMWLGWATLALFILPICVCVANGQLVNLQRASD